MKRILSTVLLAALAVVPAFGQSKSSVQAPTFEGIKLGVTVKQLPACAEDDREDNYMVSTPCFSDGVFHDGKNGYVWHGETQGDCYLTLLDGKIEAVSLTYKSKYAAARFNKTGCGLGECKGKSLVEKYGRPTHCSTTQMITGLGIPVTQLTCTWHLWWGVVGFQSPHEDLATALEWATTKKEIAAEKESQ